MAAVETSIFSVGAVAPSSANAYCDSWSWSGLIDDIAEPGYRLKRPIPYVVRRLGDFDFQASFEDANVAIGGTSRHDVFQALLAAILDAFDSLRAEPRLGPAAAEQLALLNDYLAVE